MPHIKVKKIDDEVIESIVSHNPYVKFRALAIDGDDELLAINYKNEEFLIQLKRDCEMNMLKYDKVTRPLKVNIIKEILALLASEHKLQILSSNIAHSQTKPPLSSEYFKKIKDFESIEFPFEKVSIEVGFGSGRHLLHQAIKNPDTLFIGLEIHTPSAQQVLKQIDLQNLHNIWVVNYDARLFLEMLPSNLCEQIFVHFPVPWDKKPQRRVIGDTFVQEALRVLRIHGTLELRTDSDKYFWFSLETFMQLPKAKVELYKNKDLSVVSKYEARWKKQEKDIYEVHLSALEESPLRSFDFDFSFGECKYLEGLEERLPKKSIIVDEYFVHFERVFRVESDGLLIKCAFGSFSRPEHKYILLGKNQSRYFGSLPVKTQSNIQAHKKIMEYFPCPQMS